MLSSFASCSKVKLSSWNDGKALQGVKVRLANGDAMLGLIYPQSNETSITIRVADRFLPVHIATSEVESIEVVPETQVDEHAYKMEHKKGLGGLGTHIRRRMFPDSEEDDVGGFVGNADGRFNELRRLAKELDSVEFFFDDAERSNSGLVPCILPGRIVPHFVTLLAESQFVVEFPNVRRASIMADSLNRAPHQYGQQLKYMDLADVGCTRSFWRFKFSHMPDARRKSCFSWPAWAQIVADEVERDDAFDRIHELELPLRAYVQMELIERRKKRNETHVSLVESSTKEGSFLRCTEHALDIEAARLCGLAKAYHLLGEKGSSRFGAESTVLERALSDVHNEISELRIRQKTLESKVEGLKDTLCKKRKIPEDVATDPMYFVIKPLTDEQSVDAINAFHTFYYAHGRLSEDEKTIKRAKLQHYPQTTGHFVHWTSAYDLSDENIGNGEKPRYAVDMEKLPNSVKNKLRVLPDGSVRGKGKQAYKGRFEREGAYDPKRQLVRTKLHEREMEAPPLVGI